MSHIYHRISSPSLLIFFLLLLSACGPTPASGETNTTSPINTPSDYPPSIEPSTQTPYVITATPEEILSTPVLNSQGVFFLSLEENGNFHLFAYSLQTIPLTRLTSEAWDDITPALSPDGNQLAFSSRRNGYWDLFLLDLNSGGLIRLTDTPEFDSNPSWSPDGAFITYESYIGGNLEILIRSMTDLEQGPIQLTQDPAADSSPAWSTLGRQIAFISNRSGEPEVWIADLDHAGQFSNISDSSSMVENHPAWSPDGSKLAWAATDRSSGMNNLFVWDSNKQDGKVRWAGSGDWPVWQDNVTLASRLPTPNQTFLSSSTITGSIIMPPVLLPGPLNGFSYGFTRAVLPGPFLSAAMVTPDPSFNSGIDPQLVLPSGRVALADLSNVTAAYPQLNELAIGSYQELRTRVAGLTGWDGLGNLENAYVPLTTPLEPGLGEDWLFTGRAFSLNPNLIQANWMVVVREDFNQQIYWRVYLRTFAQDGSQGSPLSQIPWDFSARASSSTAYENGGELMPSIPEGYWLDLTTLAIQYGWERIPALSNWRTYYAGARFNELVFPQGLDWVSCMLQLYPPEVLVTPTIVIPPTRTPTRTPLYYRSPTSTRTPTARPTTTP